MTYEAYYELLLSAAQEHDESKRGAGKVSARKVYTHDVFPIDLPVDDIYEVDYSDLRVPVTQSRVRFVKMHLCICTYVEHLQHCIVIYISKAEKQENLSL